MQLLMHLILRHKIYLDCQELQMQSDENLTRQSTQSLFWSQERQVYYYSNFDLFNCIDPEQEFYQFTTFIQKVATQLGKQWQREAQMLYSPYLNHNRVFLTLMELWLSQHPPSNTFKNPKTKLPPFNPNFITLFHSHAFAELKDKHRDINIVPPSPSLKAVCIGFFMTANQVWEDLFQNKSNPQSQPFSNSLLRGMTSTIQMTFRPLMVISQKINSVLGRKKRKFNEQTEPNESDHHSFDNCYQEFRRTLDLQKQLQRKMSDFDIETEEKVPLNKTIEKKNFNEDECPIKYPLLNNVYSYVTQFLNRKSAWQVASSFVTQILQMNQVRLDQGKKVKVMRPAQDFYHKLIMVWLMLQKRGQINPTFAEFLNCLRTSFFYNSWQERYLIPAKYFFQTMREDWHQIKKQNSLKTEKQVLNIFIKKIRCSMHSQWDYKIKLKTTVYGQ